MLTGHWAEWVVEGFAGLVLYVLVAGALMRGAPPFHVEWCRGDATCKRCARQMLAWQWPVAVPAWLAFKLAALIVRGAARLVDAFAPALVSVYRLASGEKGTPDA